MSKKSALVYCGARRGYEVLLVDPEIMTKDDLIKGRISYVLNDVKTFPNVDTEQTFGVVTAEQTWVRFTFECSARADLRTLVHYAVGMDRFGGFPIRFSSHSGILTISTCKTGKLGGISKFMLRAMKETAFTLNKASIEFIDANGIRKPQTVVWSRKKCETFTSNTQITAEVQVLRKAYSKGKL
jgi:hypothetical protein